MSATRVIPFEARCQFLAIANCEDRTYFAKKVNLKSEAIGHLAYFWKKHKKYGHYQTGMLIFYGNKVVDWQKA